MRKALYFGSLKAFFSVLFLNKEPQYYQYALRLWILLASPGFKCIQSIFNFFSAGGGGGLGVLSWPWDCSSYSSFLSFVPGIR